MTAHKRPKIIFLFSDTGGGHRSAAEAIIGALKQEYGTKIESEMVDIFKDHAPIPFDRMPEIHSQLIKTPKVWGMGYRLSDTFMRTKVFHATLWPYLRQSARELILQHPADLIVSVHPLANSPILRALGSRRRIPFVTVVTDLITTHALWYDKRADLCIVPTEPAKERALEGGLTEDQVQVLGLPIDQAYNQPRDQLAARRELSWPEQGLIALMVAGGYGVGMLHQIAQAVAEAKLPITLVAVTGRNQKLKAQFESTDWPIPVLTYGFTDQMTSFMQAADIIITKAGPGTISEAFCSGLPIILYDRLPGQEEGNVAYVTTNGAGVWAPSPSEVVESLSHWIDQPTEQAKVATASKALAKPQAARDIARVLATRAGLS